MADGKNNISIISHPVLGKIVIKKVILVDSEGENRRSLNEGDILQKLSHPSIIKPLSYSRIDNSLILILPYMKGGDLFEWLLLHPFPPEDTSRVIIRQLSSALSYIHSLGLSHRDVKLENVLVGNGIFDIKLCDFGYSLFMGDDLLQVYGGSYEYAAPEVLEYIPHNPIYADCWSFGVLIYMLSQNTYPFGNETKYLVETRIKTTTQPKFHAKISEEYKTLIFGLLDKNPLTRMKMEDIHSSAFLTSQYILDRT